MFTEALNLNSSAYIQFPEELFMGNGKHSPSTIRGFKSPSPSKLLKGSFSMDTSQNLGRKRRKKLEIHPLNSEYRVLALALELVPVLAPVRVPVLAERAPSLLTAARRGLHAWTPCSAL